MSVPLQIALALGSVAVLLGLMAWVRQLATKAGLEPEVQRKLVHVGTGLYALSLPWLFPDRWPVALLIGLTLVVMAVLRLPPVARGLGATLHAVKRRSYGDFLFVIAVGCCFFLADGNRLYYVLPIAVVTLADAAAALAGTVYGTVAFKVEQSRKSVEGTVVFFVIALLIAMTCLMLLSDLPAPNILALALMVAGFGTLVEAQSWRGFDNFFLPLGLFVFLSVHSETPLAGLALLAGLFLAAVLGFRLIGVRLGLSGHATRVYVVAMFLILAATSPQNAILPALVLLAHIGANRVTPSADTHAELDIVASLALIGFGWLALGNATGWNAVSFFGLSAMGLTMGLCAIALRSRMFAIPAIAALLFGLREGVVALNPAASHWAEPLWGTTLVCLALTLAVPLLAPRAFAKDRVLKLTLLALPPPFAAYIVAAIQSGGFGPFSGVQS